MTIQARSRRRLLLLLCLLILAVGAGWGIYSYKQLSLDDEARAARAEGLAAYERGSYHAAVDKLGRFLQRLEPDSEVLLRYAQSIVRLPDVDSGLVNSATSALRSCVALDAKNEIARRTLLALYMEQGALTDAIPQANWFLEQDNADEGAILAKAQALAKMRRYEEALEFLESRTPVESSSLRQHLLYLTIMSLLERAPEAIESRALQVVDARPSDPRFGLLNAHAELLSGNRKEARPVLLSLVTVAERDPEFALVLLTYLDGARLRKASLDVLKALPPASLTAGPRARLVRLLWEAGDSDSIVQYSKQWGAEPLLVQTGVLGYLALALNKLGRAEEARPLLTALRARPRQTVARGWAQLLASVLLPPSAPVRRRIEGCSKAAEIDPLNPQCRFALGEAWRQAGELELSAQAFAEAAKLAPGWAAPRAAIANLLVRGNRIGEALEVARQEGLGAGDPGVRLLRLMAESASGDSAGGTFQDRLLRSLDGADLPPTSVLPLKLSLLLTLARRNEAKALLEASLAAQRPLPSTVLHAFAEMSARAGLGLETECLDRDENLYGDSPSLALARCRLLAASEGADRAVDHFHERRSKATDASDAIWEIAEARLLEHNGSHENALRSWKLAFELVKEDPQQLLAILEAPSARASRDFLRTVVDQLRETTGEQGLGWRLHEARWLLDAEQPDETALASAISRLKEIIEVAPRKRGVRLLLASAYRQAGQVREALNQLLIAKRSLDFSVGLELHVAMLHNVLGETSSVRDVLNRVVAAGSAHAEQITAIATMYASLGDRRSALELVEDLPVEGAELGELQRRANLYASLGEYERADRAIRAVLEREESAEAILLAAAVAELREDPGRARSLRERLSDTGISPIAHARILAGHFRKLRRSAQEEAQRRQVVRLEGATREDWLHLLSCLLIQGKSGELLKTVARIQDDILAPEDGGGHSLDAKLLQAVTSRRDVLRLGIAYIEGAPDVRAVAGKALHLLTSQEDGRPSVEALTELRSLGKSHPRFVALQLILAEALLGAGQFEDALAVCRALSLHSPTSPRPFRLSAYAHRAMGRDDLAATAAREWRLRTARETLDADIFLAEQAEPLQATSILVSYLPTALEKGLTRVLVVYGKALLRLGKPQEVRDLLEPKLGTSASATQAWIQLAQEAASLGQAPVAKALLGHPTLAPGSTLRRPDQLGVAAAWQILSKGGANADALAQSREYLRAASSDGVPTSREWETIALLHAENGDASLAESAYTKAVATTPRPVIALNNLAMILARSDRANQALPLAAELVRRRPRSTDALDTLAFVYQKLGDLESALTQFEQAAKVDPVNSSWPLRAAETLRDLGRPDEALRRVREFRRTHGSGSMPAALDAKWREIERQLEAAADAGN